MPAPSSSWLVASTVRGANNSTTLFADQQHPLPTVDIGPGAVLSAAGEVLLIPNSRGFRIGSVLTGLGFVVLAFTHDYLSFLLVFLGLVAFGVHLGAALPAASLVNHWFARKRAMATTLSHIGVEIGGTLLTPLVALMVLNLGWRSGAIVTGLVFLTVVPLLSFFVRNEPESMGFRPDNAPPLPDAPERNGAAPAHRGPVRHEGDFRVREALRTSAFWQSRSSPYVLGFSWPHFRIPSVFSPRSIDTTWPMPKRSLTRATHDRIFWATIAASATCSASPRQISQAPQSSGS